VLAVVYLWFLAAWGLNYARPPLESQMPSFDAKKVTPDAVRRLAEHAIARHHPDAAAADRPALALLDAVVSAQAALIARWMHVGFVHGVMNTDNMAISGETIDYGPCAFMDAYDPGTVFSSIDHGGRYAYGSQPAVAQWNLTRLAEALLPLIGDDQESAVAAVMPVLEAFPDRFTAAWRDGMHAKLGLADGPGDEETLVDGLLTLLGDHDADWTSAFRALAGYARGDADTLDGVVAAPEAFADWLRRWTALGPDPDAMDRVNPLYIPRNHLVEDALAQATAGDLGPYRRLLEVVTRPFEARAGLEGFERGSGGDDLYVTYCGTEALVSALGDGGRAALTAAETASPGAAGETECSWSAPG
jgi:uncharacterized protein YdiU (UPF0061 family)